MKPVFFIDYDNTIFSHQTWSIPESSLEALIRLREDGYKIALASGRAFRSDSLPEEFHGRFAPDCLVSSNGAIIEIEGQLIHEKFFDPELQTRILDYVVEKNYCLMSGYNGKWVTSNLSRFREMASNKQRRLMPESGEAFRALYHQRVPSLFLSDTPEAIADLQAHFPEIKLLYMGDNLGGADIIPRENGKVKGAQRILDHYHTTFENCAAIGDSMNDVELIEAAGFGVAMGNAMPNVQARADYVTADVDHDGLAQAIEAARKHFAD